MEFLHVNIQREIFKTIGSTLDVDDILPIFYRYLDIEKRTDIFYVEQHRTNFHLIKQLIKFGIKSRLEFFFIESCERGHLELVKFLIESKSPEEVNEFYNINDALAYASCEGRLEIVKFLVEKKADVNFDDSYAFVHSSSRGHFDVVKFLVEQKADVHADYDVALQLAAHYNHFDVVKFLVEQKADIHAENDCAFKSASRKGNYEIVRLMESGSL